MAKRERRFAKLRFGSPYPIQQPLQSQNRADGCGL